MMVVCSVEGVSGNFIGMVVCSVNLGGASSGEIVVCSRE